MVRPTWHFEGLPLLPGGKGTRDRMTLVEEGARKHLHLKVTCVTPLYTGFLASGLRNTIVSPIGH